MVRSRRSVGRIAALAALAIGAAASPSRSAEPVFVDLGEVRVHCVETLRETKVREALDRPLSLKNGKASLEEFVALFAERSGTSARVEESTLEDYGILIDDVEFVAAEATPARLLLDEALPPHDLDWTIEDDALVVTVEDEASYRRRQRIYDVTSLSPADDDPAVAAVYRDRQEALAELIQATVAPDTWERRGGNGSLGTLRMNGRTLLVVSQSEQMFAKVELFLATLRKAAPAREADATGVTEPIVARVFPLSTGADEQLIDVVREFVAPESWTEEGVTIRRSSGALLVRHRPAVQAQVRAMLASMGVLAGGPGEQAAVPTEVEPEGDVQIFNGGGIVFPNPGAR